MNFPKLSTVHFLALSLALNVVLLGLVCYLFQVEPPKPLVVTAPAPAPVSPVASRVASEDTTFERAPAPAAPANAPQASYHPSAPVSAPSSVPPQGTWSVPVEFSASTPAPNTEAASAPPAVVHDANAPGNSFRFKDVVVAVEGESADVEGTGPGLFVSVSEAAPQTASGTLSTRSGSIAPATTASTAATQSPTPTTQDQSVTPSNGSSSTAAALRRRSGSPFTLEEELFRAKWGWGAFNAAQSAAAQAQAAASPAQ